MKTVKPEMISEQVLGQFFDYFIPYMSEAGISLNLLDTSSVELTLTEYNQLVELAVLDNKPDLGLTVGIELKIDKLGALGYAFFNSPNLATLLDLMSEYISLYNRKSKIMWSQINGQVEISYHSRTAVCRCQANEFTMAAILSVLRHFSGKILTPLKVEFEHYKPDSLTRHSEIFSAPIYFNQSINKIYFDESILTLQPVSVDKQLFAVINSYLQNQKTKIRRDDIENRIGETISSELSTGNVSINHVSKMMGMSVRTLQRQLDDLDLCFSDILEGIRKQNAFNYIRDTQYSISNISEMLGYKESSSFCRVFRRWAGKTPNEYRKCSA